ncbi:MAG: phosphotransferase [Reyranella sp.]|uniref:aminoglycoside phosphotransferase family protein n=1 Tax=Reyranella sp. TaxID=1929291 RepID=UPI001AC1FAAE|nr:phosphotransferase [Reyranella sp.]MBN9089796.1 phosphotransferase [Reyranella sp.]
MSDRAARRRDFVVRAGWGDAGERLLAGDASFRKYFRLTRAGGTAVVMDAPAPQEDVRPFVRIGRHLLAMKLSAPEIWAVDEADGFLLLEDLGDDTFARVLANGGDEAELYARATDVLATVHAAPDHGLLPGLGGYEGEPLIEAAMLLPEWYLPEASGSATAADVAAGYIAAWRACLANLPPNTGALLLRDFHKDNLLWLQRPGVRACGLLDFQDAQRGHASYDLVSLIEDARRDVSPKVQAACLARYLAATGLDAQDFRTGYALMAAQRHARIIGLFVRLLRRDGKPEYLPHLPRVWRMFEQALQHPALEPLRLWVDHHLPPPLRRIGA